MGLEDKGAEDTDQQPTAVDQAAATDGGATAQPQDQAREGGWHHYIPHTAAMALGPDEVARQSRLVEELVKNGKTTPFAEWLSANTPGKTSHPEDWVGGLSR